MSLLLLLISTLSSLTLAAAHKGVLPVSGDQGVHSLTDVPVYSWGPGHELFRGIQNSPDIAFK